MAKFEEIAVKELSLDLKNYRTVPQPNEESATKAMISINPDAFWGLAGSILRDGFLEIENIVVLKTKHAKPKLIVKEGNRRIAILKIIHGYIKTDSLNIPEEFSEKIAAWSKDKKKECLKAPCRVYDHTESKAVDRVINLTHGKGEKAGRDKWSAVATARHNKFENGAIEYGLDLLEKYLEHGRNLSADQKERWAGVYPLTVLNNAISRLAPRLDCTKASEVPDKYPKIKYKSELESILLAIGMGLINTDEVREEKFGLSHGIPLPPKSSTDDGKGAPNHNSDGTNSPGGNASGQPSGNSSSGSNASSGHSGGTNEQSTSDPKGETSSKSNSKRTTKSSASKTYALNDPRSVKKKLKRFAPTGKDREKIVTLKNEAWELKLEKNPVAFCFLLRSMFEISAVVYCSDNGISRKRPRSKTDPTLIDMSLAQLLNAVTADLVKKNPAMKKNLHGAMADLNDKHGLLSVVSMNQLVHDATFMTTSDKIAILFSNIFPLLEAMNA